MLLAEALVSIGREVREPADLGSASPLQDIRETNQTNLSSVLLSAARLSLEREESEVIPNQQEGPEVQVQTVSEVSAAAGMADLIRTARCAAFAHPPRLVWTTRAAGICMGRGCFQPGPFSSDGRLPLSSSSSCFFLQREEACVA